MKKRTKIILVVLGLLVLTGCTNYIDATTHMVRADAIITLNTPLENMMGGNWITGIFTVIFVYPIAQLINFLGISLHLGPTFAIGIASLLVNGIILALTFKSTVASQKMQMIQPEIQKIQDKYKDKKDQQSVMRMQQEQQALYQKHGINPLGTMGSMLIQLPVMIAMYQAVQRAEIVANGTILGQTLTGTPAQGFTSGNIVYIVIFVLMALMQFLSMKLPQWMAARHKSKKKSYVKESKPAGMGNMMTYSMLAVIVFIGWSWPIGMSIYWMVNSISMILKSVFIQKAVIERQQPLQ